MTRDAVWHAKKKPPQNVTVLACAEDRVFGERFAQKIKAKFDGEYWWDVDKGVRLPKNQSHLRVIAWRALE